MNRKARRAQTSLARKDPSQNADQAAAANARVHDLLQGKIKPPNQFVEYLLERIKEAQKEGERVIQNAAKAEAMLGQLRARRMALEGQIQAYIEDVKKWDKSIAANAPGNDAQRAQTQAVAESS